MFTPQSTERKEIYGISENISPKEMYYWEVTISVKQNKKNPKTQQDNRTICSLRILVPKG